MKLVNRYESCVGLSLPAIGRYKIEFWYAPAGYEIRPHTHPNVDIELMFLLGNKVMFYRRPVGRLLPDMFRAMWYHIGRVFSVRAGDEHYFKVSEWPLIFMNIEKWHCEPTSAATDFKLI